MRALFLSRRFIEKSQKSGKSMTILEVYKLPEVKSDGSGELVGGGVKQFFIMDKKNFEIGNTCNFGDVIDIHMEYDEKFDRGVPVGIEVLQETPYDLMSLIEGE